MIKLFKKKDKRIRRPYDLAPRGVRSTIEATESFNDVFNHIFKESNKKKDGYTEA